MNIESLGELLYACQENRLKMFKGFGEKTQQNVIDSIRFYFQHKEQHLYAQVYPLLPHLQSFLEKILPGHRIELTGENEKAYGNRGKHRLPDRRGRTGNPQGHGYRYRLQLRCSEIKTDLSIFTGRNRGHHSCTGSQFVSEQIKHSSSPAFLESLNHFYKLLYRRLRKKNFSVLPGCRPSLLPANIPLRSI